jgi:hypothetical protein
MDAYRKGLNGKQAAWAAKKYRGHHMIPDSILQDLEKANISYNFFMILYYLCHNSIFQYIDYFIVHTLLYKFHSQCVDYQRLS